MVTITFMAAVAAAVANGAAPGNGAWSIQVGVDSTDEHTKGPVPGHYDMITTKVLILNVMWQ